MNEAQRQARAVAASRIEWCKSSYSAGDNACVEVGATAVGSVIRDSKNPDGPTLTVHSGQFAAFLARVKA